MWRALERRAALLPLAAAGALVAVCALFSEGSSGGRLVWIGLASVVTAGALATWALLRTRPVLSREALVAFGLLAAFVVWCGLSVVWSIEPDRSWAYLNRGLVYVALAAIGLAVGAYVPGARRLWAYVLAVVVALALGWALLGKAVPALGGSGRIARLDAPVGYWNALALLFVFGLPLALWLGARREHPHWLRAAGVVYAYALVIGILLTYSRGGVLVAGIAVAAWLVLGGPRIESAAVLLLGGGAGLAVAVWAFSRPGLAKDAQSHSVRVHDGAWFALVFVLVAVAVGALGYLGSLAEAERPLDDRRRRLLGRVALGVLAAGAAVAVIALVAESKPQGWFRDFTAPATNPSQTVGPGRLATVSSTSRWQWWKEAWRAFEDQPAQGSGAGSFELAHRLFRTNTIVVTEPHNVPLQFLSETGVVGFLLALGSVAAARRGRDARVPGVGRGGARRRGGADRRRDRLPVPFAGGLRLGFRRGLRAVLRDGRRPARRRAHGAGSKLDAGAGPGGDRVRGRLLAADAVVRGPRDRLGAGRASGRPARRGRPRCAPRRLARPVRDRPAADRGRGR